ncbi:hypothetical protein [Virgisporangium aurantiacum]|uniref:Antibiotic biosynthesis monooxygenase n=1 Tax=Virgisporangium aurantiacum TaxID=175570 RepID=A0A8J3ZHA6_9ACTN|nr:hypothetical protein [Virgisporangium aurantiacum]GIJ64174.1 hypothetical protein Vau01_116900 [Virgisporangium aurantiacum]
MTYFAHVVDVPAPAGVYDATHTELLRRTGGHVDGLIVHLCRATEEGFQVLEVWTDRAAYERAERDLVAPILAEQAEAASGAPLLPPRVEEFALRGLVVPAGGIAT